ncbi:MAG: hypothetical protein V4559_16145 [Pseudomonadota bacterium]
MADVSPGRQALIDALKVAEEAYEKVSDQIAAALEAGAMVTPELVSDHSAAMRAAVKARTALADAEDND